MSDVESLKKQAVSGFAIHNDIEHNFDKNNPNGKADWVRLDDAEKQSADLKDFNKSLSTKSRNRLNLMNYEMAKSEELERKLSAMRKLTKEIPILQGSTKMYFRMWRRAILAWHKKLGLVGEEEGEKK